MYKRTDIETTINVHLSNQEVIDFANDLKIIPPDWEFFSVEVKGNGTGQGANIILKRTSTTSTTNQTKD